MSGSCVVSLKGAREHREIEANERELSAIVEHENIARKVPNAYFSVLCCARDLRFDDELVVVICEQPDGRKKPVNSFRITRTQWLVLRERCDTMFAAMEKIPEKF